ncbi:PA2779 family protein [Novilysobacter erysipheiresistens]|uniref:PA2779 family protein n=1 Tax=Novilysobacter erysipheiresistens TaxID=1749332 RepID=A0ABU7Z1F3_9GAMM
MFRKYVATPLLAGSLALSMVVNPAAASVISTQQALSAEMRASTEADVRASLARDDVRQAMRQLGVDPADADTRIAALSDAELLRMQGELEQLPAGGGALAVIGVVFVVLLILELVGVINIFNRV